MALLKTNCEVVLEAFETGYGPGQFVTRDAST